MRKSTSANAMGLATLAMLGSLGLAHGKYVWPSHYDVLEDMIAMQSGYIRPGFTDLVVPCGFGSNTIGKQNAAEWIRTAFHDMATHNVSAGTGGLDASIMYEVEREENGGAAFNNTLSDLFEFVSPQISTSDLIALGVVAAVASCGGPKIPFRAGRIDATSAGPTGVPEPHDSLESTVEAFDRMGFNVQEMIGLVACGHSVGQVHSVDFPDIVGGEPDAANVARFDRTSAALDTAVVDEYLESDGVNPLVFGQNATTNSDTRVFGSDGNVTMRALSDPTTFSSECGSLLERMIDTIPAGTELSQPLELQEVKPYIDQLQLDADSSTISFVGRVRVRTTASTGRDSDAITVAIGILDRGGKRTVVQATRVRFKGGQSHGFFGEVFTWFDFNTKLDAEAGVTSLDIRLTDAAGNTEIFDNAGTGGYSVQSDLLFLQTDSCLDTRIVAGNMTLQVTAAVRQGQTEMAPVVNVAHRVKQQGVVIPRLVMEQLPMRRLCTPRGSFAVYAVQLPIEADGWSTDFNIVLPTAEGEVVSGYHRTNALAQEGCLSG